jgi:hypothetical protein
MFIKIYSSVMFLGWLGNISYVPQPLSHPGSEKIKPKPLYVCPGCSNHTYSNNMVNRYNISINYRVKSYKMTGGSKRKITESHGIQSIGVASTGTTGGEVGLASFIFVVTPTFCKNKIFVQIGVHIQL